MSNSGVNFESLLPPVTKSASLAEIYVPGTPTGIESHDNALVNTALANAGSPSSGIIRLGEGIWALKLKFGSTTEGKNYCIGGVGEYRTVLVAGSTTEPILEIVGPGTVASEYFEMDSLSVCLSEDRSDANPLIKIVLQKGQLNIKPNVRFYSGEANNPGGTVVSHTGTFILMDGAYEGRIEPMFSVGKYAVPLEWINKTVLPSAGVPPNLDTVRFNSPIYGSMGHIFRDAYDGNIGANGTNGLNFEGYKHTSTTVYPIPPACEATIATEGTEGSTTLALTTTCVFPGSGKTKVAENIENGDLVTIGMGNLVECKKVTKVEEKGAETILTLSQPLRFNHAAGASAPTVIKGGKSLSLGKGYSGISLTAMHFEGPWIGISADRVSGLKLISGRAAVGEIVRMEGEVRGVEFGPIQSQGTPNRHTWLNKASYNASEAGRFGGHMALSPPITPLGITFTGKTVETSPNVTEVNTEGLEVGQKIVQTVFAAGTTILEVKTNELKLSTNASESGTGKTFTALPEFYIEPTIFNNKSNDWWFRKPNITGGGQYTTTFVMNNAGTGGKVLGQTAAWEVSSNGTLKSAATFEGTLLANVLDMARSVSAETSVTLTRTSPGYCGVGGSGARTRKLPKISEIEEGRIYFFVDEGGNAAAGNIEIVSQGTDKLDRVEAGKKIIQTQGGCYACYNAGSSIGWVSLNLFNNKQTPIEHGRSAEMTAGEITIAAPGVTATGPILITTEGGTAIGASVVERTAGTGFKVKATATSTDRIDWAVYSE